MDDKISGRVCNRCGNFKTVPHFGTIGRDGKLRAICKQCRSDEWRKRHPNPKPRGYRIHEKPGRGAWWTPEEDAALRKYYISNPQAGTMEAFAKSIGRTRLGISVRAHNLGLSTKGHINNNPSDKQKKVRQAIGALRRNRGKLINMTEGAAGILFNKFKKSRQPMSRFSVSAGFNADGLAGVFKKFFPDDYDLVQEQKLGRRDLWYKKGRAFEYRVRDLLRAKKWWVLRSPQSKSPTDLVALKPGRVLLIQCKSGGTISLKERAALYELAESVRAIPLLATRLTSRGTVLQRLGSGSGEYFNDVNLD